MRRMGRGLPVLVIFMVFLQAFAGCGGSGGRWVHTAEILSDQRSDGDILFVLGPPQQFIVTQGPNTLFFGLDEDFNEYRAFLDFPLDGSTGFDAIPLGARIESATLTVRIVSVQFSPVVPTLLDLVTYTPRTLTNRDFDSLPLVFSDGTDATRSFNIFGSDVNRDVVIEVTSFMREAQRRALPELQMRFLLDFGPRADGLVGIDNRPTVAATAPLLTVRYSL